MSMYWKIYAFTMILSVKAFGQGQPVSLKQLLENALHHNQALEIARYDQDLVEHQIAETRSRTLPSITGYASAQNNYKRQVIVLPPGAFPSSDGSVSSSPTELVSGTRYSSSAGVEVSQPLFDMAAFTGLKATQAGRDFYKLNTKQSEEQVINQVARAYYNIHAHRQTIVLLESNIENLRRLVVAAEGQYQNGLARKIDMDRLKVSLINSESQLARTKNELNTQINQLKVLVGVALETELLLSDISFDEIEHPATSELSSSEFDVSNRTEVQLVESQITLSQLQRKSIQSENFPRLSAYFNYSQNSMSSSLENVFNGRGDAINYGVGSFGLRLNVPIFDGLARNSRVKQSEVRIRQLQKRKEATVLSANANALNASIQMSNSLVTLTTQNENVKLAADVYHSSQSNYNLGLTSLTDLLEAQNSYTEAQNIYTRELLSYKIAELEILRSTGNIRKLIEE